MMGNAYHHLQDKPMLLNVADLGLEPCLPLLLHLFYIVPCMYPISGLQAPLKSQSLDVTPFHASAFACSVSPAQEAQFSFLPFFF